MKLQSDNRTEHSMAGDQFTRPVSSQERAHAPAASTDRLEKVWAWASLLVLIICWDAALRLDQRVSVPRVRIAHAVEPERLTQAKEWTEL